MNDLFGIELEVGHLIGFTTRGKYNYTLKGVVIGFTPKMVKIRKLDIDNVDFKSIAASCWHNKDGEIINLNPQNLIVSLASNSSPNICLEIPKNELI